MEKPRADYTIKMSIDGHFDRTFEFVNTTEFLAKKHAEAKYKEMLWDMLEVEVIEENNEST